MSNKIQKQLTKLDKKLDLMQESSDLGQFDNIVLSVLILIWGTALSSLSLNFKALIIIPPVLIFFIYALVLSSPILFFIQAYIGTILNKEGRFAKKSLYISLLYAELWFLGFLFVYAFILWGLEKKLNYILPENWVVGITMGLVVISYFISLKHKSKLIKYFQERFPLITKSRMKEIALEKKRLLTLQQIKNKAEEIKKLASKKNK